MKNINKYMKGLFVAAIALMAGAAMTSCEDEPDKYEVASGLPTVNYIRCLSSEIKSTLDTEETVYTNGQLVEECSPSAILALVGSNLRSVTEVYFNDLPAVMNSSYITDNALMVQVPSGVPSRVTDKIYLINKDKDTVAVDFHVIIPAPTIYSVSLEYAQPGDEITISGRYFIDDPGTPIQVFFKDANGQPLEAKINDISDDYTTMTVTVPEGVAEGEITVDNVYGEGTTSFKYMDKGEGKGSWMLFDFDGQTGLSNHGWHNRDIITDEWSINGAYLQLGSGSATMGDATWDDSNFSFEYWPGNWKEVEDYSDAGCMRLCDIADFSNWENMSLKFELCVPSANPWSAGSLQIIPGSPREVTMGSAGSTDIYGNTCGGCNNTYISGEVVPRAMYRPWTVSGSFDTGDKWITVTIPLTDFIYGYTGATASGTITEDTWSSMVFFLCGGGVAGTECTPVLKIDNIRVVKN